MPSSLLHVTLAITKKILLCLIRALSIEVTCAQSSLEPTMTAKRLMNLSKYLISVKHLPESREAMISSILMGLSSQVSWSVETILSLAKLQRSVQQALFQMISRTLMARNIRTALLP